MPSCQRLAFFVSLVFSTLVNLPHTAVATEQSDLEAVKITAMRLDTSHRENGTSIIVISEEMIKSRGYVYVTDALAIAPGVTINQNGTFGGQAGARIRGASSDQTLVLIDGVPVNDTTSPGGGFDFGTLDTIDISRIEILKGPQSTLWGTDAIGGVINIVTKPPAQDVNGDVSLEGGSFTTRRLAATLSGANTHADFRLSISDIKTNGISKADAADGNSEVDGFASQTLAIKGGIQLRDAHLTVNFRSTEATAEFDQFGVVTGVEDGDEISDTKHSSGQLAVSLPLFDGRLQNTLTYAQTELERKNFSLGVAGFSATGERQLTRYEGNLRLTDKQQFAFGYELEDTKSATNQAATDGLFLLYQVAPIPRLNISLGVRREDHALFATETVGRISATWSPHAELSLRTSWGEGFKVPTIFQTTFFCCGASTANTALKPETSEGVDIGFDWRFANNQGTLGLTYFDQTTQNLITFSFAIGGYENVAEVTTTGVELSFSYDIADVWALNASAAYVDSEDTNGEALPSVPITTADLGISWQPSAKLNTHLAVIYNGEATNSFGIVGPWTRVDFSMSYAVRKQLEVFGRIENLFNEQYQQIFGYGTPQRSLYLGLRYQF